MLTTIIQVSTERTTDMQDFHVAPFGADPPPQGCLAVTRFLRRLLEREEVDHVD